MPGICDCECSQNKRLRTRTGQRAGKEPVPSAAAESCNSRATNDDIDSKQDQLVSKSQKKRLTQCEHFGSRPVEAQPPPDQAETHCWSIARAAAAASASAAAERAVKILFPQRSFSCVFDFSSCRTILQLSSACARVCVRVCVTSACCCCFLGPSQSLSRRGR